MSYRTTIKDSFASLKTRLETLIGVSPDGSLTGLREIGEGEGATTEYPVPFLALRILHFQSPRIVDGDKEWKVTVKFRIVAPISGPGTSQADALEYAAQVEDCLETWTLPDGMAGLENAEWSITLPSDATHGALLFAESIRTYTVMVTRGSN